MQSAIPAFGHALQWLSVMTHSARPIPTWTRLPSPIPSMPLPACPNAAGFFQAIASSPGVSPHGVRTSVSGEVSLARYGEGVSQPMIGVNLAPSVMAETAPTIPAVSMP